MSWPGVIEPGTECDTPITSVDFLPTFAEMAGAELPRNQPVDGTSILPLLKGGALNERSIFWHYPLYLEGHKSSKVLPVAGTGELYWRAVPSSMLVRGDWKLIHLFEDDSVRLYNVAQDIGEQTECSKKHPELAQKLFAELQAWQKATGAIIPTEENPAFGKPPRKKNKAGKKNKK